MIPTWTPGVVFAKVDVDEADTVAKQFKIESMPTIKCFRGKNTDGSLKEVATIVGGGPQFLVELDKVMQDHLTSAEAALIQRSLGSAKDSTTTETRELDAALGTVAADVQRLAEHPLKVLEDMVLMPDREAMGLPLVPAELAFDVSRHEAAQSKVAMDMLGRMQDDVGHWASVANTQKTPKMKGLTDDILKGFLHNPNPNSHRNRNCKRDSNPAPILILTCPKRLPRG